MPEIEVFPFSMKPVSFNLSYKSWFLAEDPVMKKILEKRFLVKSGKVKRGSLQMVIQVEGLPLRMFKYEHNNQYRSTFIFRDMNNNYAEHITRKMKFLI